MHNRLAFIIDLNFSFLQSSAADTLNSNPLSTQVAEMALVFSPSNPAVMCFPSDGGASSSATNAALRHPDPTFPVRTSAVVMSCAVHTGVACRSVCMLFQFPNFFV